MRVTNIGLYSVNSLEQGIGSESLIFSLSPPGPTDQFLVRTIIGLDAEEIIPKFYGFSASSKARFYDFGLKARDIVMRVVLRPRFHLDESYSDVRDELYRAISANRSGQIVLHFNSGATTVARIFGFIVKFEVGYFNKEPEAQFTIRCDDPMFRAINPVRYEANELKTVNPIVVPDSLSTSPHGFTFKATFKAVAPSFTIQDLPTNPEWKFVIVPNGGFLVNDVLYFSSDYSNKYLYIIRGGTTIYLVDKIQPESIWPVIFPGSNEFHFVNLAAINWNELEYYAAYWGV